MQCSPCIHIYTDIHEKELHYVCAMYSFIDTIIYYYYLNVRSREVHVSIACDCCCRRLAFCLLFLKGSCLGLDRRSRFTCSLTRNTFVNTVRIVMARRSVILASSRADNSQQYSSPWEPTQSTFARNHIVETQALIQKTCYNRREAQQSFTKCNSNNTAI